VRWWTSSLFFVLVPVVACTIQQNPGGGDGGGGGADASADGAVAKSGTDSCAEALTCVGACKDDPCANACLERATPAAQQKVVALAQCINDHGCMDATCAKASCASEIDACVADPPGTPADAGAPVQGTPPPAELVGIWSYVGLDNGHTYTFYANGTYDVLHAYSNAGTCLTIDKLNTFLKGAVTIQGDQMVLSPASSEITTTDCNGKTTKKTSTGSVVQFTWSIQGNKLTLSNASATTTFTKQ